MLKCRLIYGQSSHIWNDQVPLYEYRCYHCKQVTSVLVRTTAADNQLTCEHCASVDMEKIISKFPFRGSWGNSLNWVPGRETMSDVNDNSPASVDNYMGRIKKEMGGQTTPDFSREPKDIKNS